MRRTAFGLFTLSRTSQQQDIYPLNVSSQPSTHNHFFRNQNLANSYLFVHDYNMKLRQFTLAMAPILEILAMHVLTLAIPTSSSSPVDVAASVNGASAYSRESLNLLQGF